MISEKEAQEQVKQLLYGAGWNSDDIIEEQTVYFQGKVMRVDIILLYHLYPLAVIEIKRFDASLELAADQAFRFAEAIDVPFAFVADGTRIIKVSTLEGESQTYEKFPAPSELWSMLGGEWNENDPRLFPPFRDRKMTSRVYQAQAVSRAVEAVVNGEKRLLLSMATGTGKTYVAFQIAWKLVKSGRCQRMLYLSPRQAIIDSAIQVFRPFGEDLLLLSRVGNKEAFHRVHLGTTGYFVHHRKAPTFQEFPSNFYDLIIISDTDSTASTASILEHFQEAVILRFTSREIPSSKVTRLYGQPIFTYSLEEALATEEIKAPEGFKVVQLDDIAEIRSGIMVGKNETGEESEGKPLYMVTARAISLNGSIDLEKLSKVKLGDTRIVNEVGEIDARVLLQNSDILVASLSPGTNIRVGIVPQNLLSPTTISNSLIRIRVDPNKADPKEVFMSLRSDVGQLVMRKFAIAFGTTVHRISVRDLRQIPVFLPESQVVKDIAEEELSAVSRVKQQLKDEILPFLENLDQKSRRQTQINDQELELVARKLREVAVIMAPPKLSERVMADYPTPIALAYRRFHDARFNAYERVLRLRDLFESTAYYVYNLVLADAFRRLDPVQHYIDDKGARRAYNGYSMSTRMDFVARLLEINEYSQGKELFIPELVGSSVTVLAKQLQDDLRNRLSHTATATESQQRSVIKEFQPIVEGMLSDLEYLASYRLVRIPSFYFKRGNLVRRMELYHGVVPELLEEQIPSDNVELINADHDHLLLLDAEDRVLDLYPLYQLVASKETRYEKHLCFFKQRKASIQRLEGESVQGAFPVSLEGFEDFEILQSRIIDTPPEE